MSKEEFAHVENKESASIKHLVKHIIYRRLYMGDSSYNITSTRITENKNRRNKDEKEYGKYL